MSLPTSLQLGKFYLVKIALSISEIILATVVKVSQTKATKPISRHITGIKSAHSAISGT
jgi:hypothetical protein